MFKIFKKQRVSEIISISLVRFERQSVVTIRDVMKALGLRSLAVVILFFSLMVLLPISVIPGASVILGVIILFLAVQLVLGVKSLWLPDWILRRQLPKDNLISGFQRSLRYVCKIEKLLKPRWMFISSNVGERLLGLFIILLIFLLVLPIPFSNFPIGLSLCFIAAGLMEEDGLLITVGILGGILFCGFAFATLTVMFQHALSLFS